MTDTALSLSDTSTWLPLDGLAPGFDANKAPTVGDLHGSTLVLERPDGSTLTASFTGTRVEWDGGVDQCETFLVDDGLYYVQLHAQANHQQAVSLFLDTRFGRALEVRTTIGDGRPRVTQTFTPATIQGVDVRGETPAPSTALIGRRAMWIYSEAHAYEHVYLSRHWYTWQCLAGPEKGLADTDENTVYELRPGIYVFTWREKVIPCASVTVADHRDARRLRSHGVLFGLDETGQTPTHFTFGAHGRMLSNTVHPNEYDPAID
ncbi:molybdenum cofactor biosynthesis F family protein [Actinokineospora sp. NBRC 105648]|uniref:molybdenum cofactor biosynthesis F family protein n=1 Tax=Actinokineospora sp. NBRC 105648 TaxID=3032206 RepID=UPI0024A1F735|nr:molybdenum cofactor biosynthesis F family protein [Actinokineospora sp. NBRC 105648]GLZ39335.1 molybdenum cofactor biosynthesis protein F [Actinokineospora sp. NBRC 105648]